MEYLGTILIVLVVLIVIFFLLREVNCWYWKINKTIELQTEHNMILKSILEYLEKSDHNITNNEVIYSKEESVSSKIMKIDNDTWNLIQEVLTENKLKLSGEEKTKIAELLSPGLNNGERIVLNKNSRKINKFDSEKWTNSDQSEWITLMKK